eukprot:c23523_g1_i1.p1 GENE.c23523_g1_i1~~c23523_g1_i1.p1  ORF type:complete len:184 (-),score=35.91 c23523_g1_i1:75-626(-)
MTTNNQHLQLHVELKELFLGAKRSVKLKQSNGTEEKERSVMVDLVGLRDGDVVTFEPEIAGFPGVEITIVEHKHSIFRREGDNLVVRHMIDVAELLTSRPSKVYHIDNRALDLYQLSVTKNVTPSLIQKMPTPGQSFVVAQEGLPRKSGGRGDLEVHFDVRWPENALPTNIANQVGELLRDLA